MGKRYTEGVCQDGAAILDNGKPITVSEILNKLNSDISIHCVHCVHLNKETFECALDECVNITNNGQDVDVKQRMPQDIQEAFEECTADIIENRNEPDKIMCYMSCLKSIVISEMVAK